MCDSTRVGHAKPCLLTNFSYCLNKERFQFETYEMHWLIQPVYTAALIRKHMRFCVCCLLFVYLSMLYFFIISHDVSQFFKVTNLRQIGLYK